ncbi:sensor domain-containing protein [Streptomyces sp. NPDC006367]|uniref:sensor domain-containing protein n=1 Tax=unclassified Streptomyces TaxID=2593676 RepID=UPI0033BF7C5D
MQPTTAWQAVAQRPLRFLTSSWPWRSLAYLSSGVVVGTAAVSVLALGLALGLALLVVLIGVAPLAGMVLVSTLVARVERRRLRIVDLDRLPDPHRAPDAPGLRAWSASWNGSATTSWPRSGTPTPWSRRSSPSCGTDGTPRPPPGLRPSVEEWFSLRHPRATRRTRAVRAGRTVGRRARGTGRRGA